MPAYGNASANAADVEFPFAEMSPACRDLWAMAEAIAETETALNGSARDAEVDWKGPERKAFRGKVDSYVTSANNISRELRHLAQDIAKAWSDARGQQDRINHARYVQHENNNDNILEDVKEFFGGETDYGLPPDNPSVPQPPSFAKTRDPMHTKFGP